MAWQGTLGNGQPVARILLKDADGPLMLTVLPPNVIVEGLAPMDDGRHFAGQTLDGNCVAWREGDLIMILGARRDADALREISQSIR
jgi:hypothetical protein